MIEKNEGQKDDFIWVAGGGILSELSINHFETHKIVGDSFYFVYKYIYIYIYVLYSHKVWRNLKDTFHDRPIRPTRPIRPIRPTRPIRSIKLASLGRRRFLYGESYF